MQGKGFIKFIAIILALLCAYYLSFSLVAGGVENDAKAYAKGDPAKERAYLDSMATVPVYPIFGFNYQFVKNKELNLGLDLKGGMNVTMEISLAELINKLANNPDNPKFHEALTNAERLQQTNSSTDFVTLFINEFERLQPGVRLADYFSNPETADQLKADASNSDVKTFLQKEGASAVDRSFTILRSRIDGFGVATPNMQKEQGTNRILIEMPGVQDRERVHKLLQGSAELQFWNVYQMQEVYPLLQNINNAIATTGNTTAVAADTAKTDTTTAGGKLAGLTKGSAVKDSVAQGVKGKDPLFAILQLPSVQTQQGMQLNPYSAVLGLAVKNDTGKVNKMLAQKNVAALIPQNLRFMWSVKADPLSKKFELYAIKVTTADGQPLLGGEAVSNARADYDQSGKPEVSMTMNPQGAAKWKNITAEASADPVNKKQIAIVLDNQVYTAPTVNGEIPTGSSSITGNFTVEDTKDLANILKAGRLPAPAKIVGEFIVGPTLGQQAIHNGLLSFAISFVVILVFMAFYYNKAGWVANLVLLINMFFIMGILVSLGAVLTLPGIAGIVLVIGLSVDANILIFERIREELATGKSMSAAISEGFKHAMPSILDSNITVLILGIILYIFGSGPVQGFATTLCIGILSSLFAAVLLSRLIFDWLLKHNKPISFDRPATRNAFKNIAINFVAKRKLYYIISSVIIVLGIIFYFKNGGLNLGIDFKGGRTYVVHFDKPTDLESVRHNLTTAFGGEAPEVKTAGGDNQLKITTTYMVEKQTTEADAQVEKTLSNGLQAQGGKFEILSAQKVTPVIANDILYGAYGAILFSCVLMFVYIFVRFRKWQYGLGAVAALFHDVLMVLSFYTILDGVLPFSLEIGQDFIAAILTVMGYTMTETVVVFDRIREQLSAVGKTDVHGEEKKKLINFALNSTLSRTILTSLTIFFVLLVIFIFGGDSIRGFIFALLIGRVIGTYSSLCISTPIVVDLSKDTRK